MKRFLICSGIYGQAQALERLENLVREKHPEGILFAGGVLDRPHECVPCSFTDFGYTDEDARFVEHFFDTLGRLNVFSAIIPGGLDAPLDLFLKLGMGAELIYPRLHVVHATPVVTGDVAIFGLGGCIDGYTNTNIGYYSRILAEYYLRSMTTIESPRTMLLLPEPLECWHGDVENSRLTDDLIATNHPQVCVIGRSHKTQGVEHLASTLIIRPGYLSEGCAAWLDWGRDARDQVTFLSCKSPASEEAVKPMVVPALT